MVSPYVSFAKFDVEKFKEWIKKHTTCIIDKKVHRSDQEKIGNLSITLVVKYKSTYDTEEKDLVNITLDELDNEYLISFDVIDLWDYTRDNIMYQLTEEQYKELYEFLKNMKE